MDRDAIHRLAGLYGSAVDDRRGNVLVQCPMAPITHRDGVNPKPALSIKIEPHGKSPAHCWSCSVAGTVVSIFREAQERLGGLDAAVAFAVETDKGGLGAAWAKHKATREASRLPIDRQANPDWTAYAAECAKLVPRYVIERGLVRSDIEKWRVGLDRELARATFPVWDEDRNVVGVARRAIMPGQEPKFWDTHGDWKHRVFYGENFFDATREHAYLVEGVFATIFAKRILPNVLGMLGAQPTIEGERLEKLRRWCRSVTIVFDADDAGRKAVYGWTDDKGRRHLGLRETLRPYFAVKVARLPEGCDPADVPAHVLRNAVENAEYLLRP